MKARRHWHGCCWAVRTTARPSRDGPGETLMHVKGIVFIGLLAGLTGLAAAPAQSANFECPRKGGELTFASEAKINSLDMHASNAISTRNVAMNLYESLMTRNEKNEPILELADSLSVSPDGMSFTFKLRSGIHFHNGKELSSADVVAAELLAVMKVDAGAQLDGEAHSVRRDRQRIGQLQDGLVLLVAGHQ